MGWNYHDLTHSPVALWQLDGDLSDISGNAYHLSLVAGTESYTDVSPGLQGFSFDGATTLASGPEAALQITGDVTVEMLVRTDRIAVSATDALNYMLTMVGTIASELETENILYSIGLTKDTNGFHTVLEHDAGVDESYAINDGLIPFTGVHLALVRESNVYKFYLNGSLIGAASGTITAPTGGGNANCYLGGFPAEDTEFVGAMASVKIINFALDSDQISAEANHTIGTPLGPPDTTPPFVEAQSPAPGSTNVAADTNIFLRVNDDAGVDLATVQVSVDTGSGFVNAVVNGVIQAAFSGGGESVVAVGAGYEFTLDPVTNLPDGETVTVRVDATDTSTNAMAQVEYSFDIFLSTSEVPNNGGYEFVIAGTFTAGDYIVHVGPNEDATDPIAYPGVPGGGSTTTFVDVSGTATATVWLPPLPIGGPYRIYLEQVSGGPASVLTGVAVIVRPHVLSNRRFSIKSMLPPKWRAGARSAAQVRYPQT